jgi:phospholipid/cholesterol/gamma-HCH transport system ATP-binding protein
MATDADPTASEYAIELRGLVKSFGDKTVLEGLDLRIRRGEVMFIVGTSGVGKSVTIKHLVGLLRPDEGQCWFGGRRVDDLSESDFFPVRKKLAMVFQSSTLFDSMTLLENVALPLRKHRHLAEVAAEREAMRYLEKVQLGGFAHRSPAEVGDGIRKRVAIARALTLDPEAVLFDEPTTGLDPVSARRVDRLIRQLADELKVTCVVVSHDLTSIFGIADRICFIYRGTSHVVATPAELRASPDPVVQQFITGRSTGPMETPGF